MTLNAVREGVASGEMQVDNQPAERALLREVPPGDQKLFTRERLGIAGALVVLAFIVFCTLDKLFLVPITHPSANSYFVYQAWAWLQGRWDIVPGPSPINQIDLIVLNGQFYSIYAPFPALLMVPFVAVFGRDMSDTLFTIIISAVNLGLVFLLFEQLRLNGLTQRRWRENVVWSIFLYLSSIALYLSLGGKVWWTAHIVACGCLVVSLLLAFKRYFVWGAVALGCAVLTRGTLLLAFPFLLYLAWDHGGTDHSLKRFAVSLWRQQPAWTEVPWKRLGAVVAVFVGTIAVYLARNAAMFGDPLETGYGLLNAQHYPLVKHGLFSLRYLPANIINTFFNFPHVIFSSPFNIRPRIDMLNLPGTGISVFFTTPLFLFLFWRNKNRSELRVALWAIIGLMAVFTLLYYTSGYFEFGTRYLFDLFPYAWVLLLLQDVRLDWRAVALGVFSFVVNVMGAYQFWTYRMIDLSKLPHF